MKNIWIFNHYATDMYANSGGRHHWFAKYLKKSGYNPTIFCANTFHTKSETIDTKGSLYLSRSCEGVPYVFVKTFDYKENGIKRVLNMISFYFNLKKVVQKYKKEKNAPDIILASSVHPLTLVAGIKIAKKLNIPCICEVRDLWPESIVAYGLLKRDSLIAKMLYIGEKWIYKRADSIIMTWEGAKDYIIDQGWEQEIDEKKIHYISNGVDLESFDKNCIDSKIEDKDLDSSAFKNIVYAGSIRKVNNVGILLDVAKILKKNNLDFVRFLIYGSGDEVENLKKRCNNEDIDNVIFKGRVEKKYIPSILKRGYANILHNSSTPLDKYGQSQNKLFEYMASGRPIIQTYSPKYNICLKNNCGLSANAQTPQAIVETILKLVNDEKLVSKLGLNAKKNILKYDFKSLTKNLINIIEEVKDIENEA